MNHREPILVALSAPQVEAQPHASHILRVRVLGPDLPEVTDPMDLSLQMQPGPSTPPGWDVRSVIPLGVRFQPPGPGTYSIDVAADNHWLSVPLVIRLP